jgi:anti-sigma B factor antagonist
MTMDGFIVHSERDGSVHRLTPLGELDLATVPILEREFQAVHPDPAAEMIVVDLTKLSFMDSTGIAALMRMNDACEEHDRLRIVNGSPAVVRVLDVTGVRPFLPIISSHDNPLAPRPMTRHPGWVRDEREASSGAE